MPVLGQQDPILFSAARGECAVGKPACRNDSAVTGRTQPSAEVAQHLVAEEPPHLPGPEASEPAWRLNGCGHQELIFRDGITGFIERHRAALVPPRQPAPNTVLTAAALSRLLAREDAAKAAASRSGDPFSPWARADASLEPPSWGSASAGVNGLALNAEVTGKRRWSPTSTWRDDCRDRPDRCWRHPFLKSDRG
jgi:hypothetical protein